MEKSTTIMRDKSGAALRRDGQRKTGGGGGAGAMAAAAAAAAAGASKGTSAAAAAAFVTVTSAAGGSFPDIKSDGNGGGSQADSCEETSEGKRSSNCVPSSIDSTQQGTGTSGCNSRQGGSDSPSSSLDGRRRICEGNLSGSRFGSGAKSGGGNSPRDYNNCDKNSSDNNSSSGNDSKKSGSPVFQESGSDDGTGSSDGRSQEGRDTGFEFAEASPEAQAAPPTS